MVVWRAAEKDTWVHGEKAECVICFEEFEEGDVIARLECLCRYHKVCFLSFGNWYREVVLMRGVEVYWGVV